MGSAERLYCMEKVLAHYFTGKPLTDQELRKLAASIPEEGPLNRSSRDQAVMIDGLSTETVQVAKTQTHSLDNKETAIRLTTILQVTQKELYATNTDVSLDTQLQLDALNDALSCLPPQPIAKFLLEVFFRYIQTSIYYVEEKWIYETLDRCCSRSLDNGPDDSPTVCILLMVMACGTQFAHMESSSISRDTTQGHPKPSHFSEDDIGQTFHGAARKLLPYIIVSPSFQSVQALLMMATYNFSLDPSGTSYAYLSHALSLGVEQGMHDQKYYDAEPSKTLAEVKRRVWWTIYILQMQLSIKYGRPHFLDPFDVTVQRPVDIPELHPLKEVSSFENQLGLINLTLMTQTISKQTALLRKSNDSAHFFKLLTIRKDLIKWREPLHWEVASIKHMDLRSLRNHIHLRLYYWNTRLSLGQPFMLASSSLAASSESVPETAQFIGRAGLVKDSVDSALEIISLCQMLRDHVGFARASYVTEFMSCFTAVLVLLAQTLAQPSPSIREALSRGLELIRTMSTGCMLARSEVSIIEALERAVIRLQNVQRQRSSPGAPSQVAQEATNYDTFKTWTRLWKSTSGLTPPEQTATPHATGSYDNAQSLQQDFGESADGDMFYGLLPMELSQFDVIPFLDTGFDYEDASFNAE
ncbi:hypothetical protein PFICI_09231 [Pestalotiopsis fici W106-1]|uniref:Xylanolytic transcriptional activator regulatory domain-containing protein n=1 Tax=Pestalotiopsis fici (strain W106-1 / CGMCC3.15140) TaxID=1229662 RepID=W3WZR8_PESFW|nr:uncharacterized protein PFICI_09231 [Pestalotiopsis fici W106-1]ETS79378.1 hypothetical protein PFICI_09231 [Pestalotiopsis fici W106-1]